MKTAILGFITMVLMAPAIALAFCIHPTQKPVRLAERALRKHSEVNDIVLDLFSGSASTLIGCEQGQRKARVMELDPKYVHAGIKRFLRFRPDVPTHCLTRSVDMVQFKT